MINVCITLNKPATLQFNEKQGILRNSYHLAETEKCHDLNSQKKKISTVQKRNEHVHSAFTYTSSPVPYSLENTIWKKKERKRNTKELLSEENTAELSLTAL